MAYTRHTWTNGSGTKINATNLNEVEDGVYNAHVTADAAVPKSVGTTAGDIIYFTGASTPARLAAGAAGTVLKGGATPSWATIVNADVSASAAVDVSKLAAGSNGQYLTTSGSTPTWTAAPTSALTKIYDSTLGASAASVDITSIAATYAHLQLVIFGRTDRAATEELVTLRFNGDLAANYDSQYHQGVAAAATAGEALGITAARLGYLPGTTATANLPGGIDLMIHQYAGTTFHKTLHARYTHKNANTTGATFVGVHGGGWRSTAAINQITLTTINGANFIAGTRVTLYGLSA